MISLDSRLGMLAELTEPCEIVADIGTDHGLLGVYLLQKDICRHVQFLDISVSSLEKARRLVAACHLEQRAYFNTGDGASALLMPADQAVVAGMGAETIVGIIERGRAAFGNARLILQPNLDVEGLRAALGPMGYEIVDERIALAAGRHYVAIKVQPGKATYSPRECLVGPVLIRGHDDLLSSYARFRLRVLTKAMKGARKSEPDKAARYAWEISVWKEFAR